MKKYFYYFVFAIATSTGFAILSSCGGDEVEDMKVSVPDQTLYHEQTYNIPANGNWTSSNDLIASVSNNTVEAVTVGKAKISNGSSSFNVTVKPRYNYFEEPYLGWGASVSTVKNKMAGYSIYKETSNAISYKGNKKETNVIYNFEGGKLKSVMVYINRSSFNSIGSTLGDYILERYIILDLTDSTAGFITNDKKTIVAMMYDSDGVYLYYAPSDKGNKVNGKKCISDVEFMI